MCGIYGIWHLDGRPLDPAALRAATDRLRHRGPDDEGYLLAATRAGTTALCAGLDTDPRLGHDRLEEQSALGADLGLGFRRLAIQDLSPAGHQPMATPDGLTWIIFNGEVYNFIELREELIGLGHRFRSGADTEVVLAAYRQWGDACLQRLNGMWAFAIWDVRERRLLLARDRFGVKPLYYMFDGHTFAFASEPKALVGALGVPFIPDERAVYRYLAGGLLPSPRDGTTFFAGVHALPPGHTLALHAGTPVTRRYWRLEPDDSATLGANAAVEVYGALFADALRLQLRSDVAVGTCLSGGVDSSSIVCVVNRLMQGEGLSAAQIGDRQKTFSAVYAEEGPYNERAYVERVIAATGAERNLTFPDAVGLLRDLEALVWHQDEPFLSTSIFAQWCVMSAVRARGVTVLLDGQGADESLAGYRPFAIALGDTLRSGRVPRALADALAMQARTGLSPLPIAGRALALQLPARLRRGLQQVRGAWRSDQSPLCADFVARSGHETPADWWDWTEHGTLQGHLRNQIEESSLPHLLRYEDRNSMAFGVEARVPFLDHRLVELAFGGAAPWRIKGGWTKWVLRQAMEGIVPDSVIWRASKIGFETPESDWLAGWLRANPDCFRDGARSGDYLNLAAVRRAIIDGTATAGDKGRLWRWINLELWLSRWSVV
jgi:asparagine synthase (glutamine-hydrolysing)